MAHLDNTIKRRFSVNKRSIFITVAIATLLSSNVLGQLYTQADKETLSTSEIMAAKNKYKTAKIICLEKARKAKVKNPINVKKAQTNLYIVCMSSKGFSVSEMPDSE